MREVSCRALEPFFIAADRRNISRSELSYDTGYGLRHLEDRGERIDWDSFRTFMTNVGRHFDDDEIKAIGAWGLQVRSVKWFMTIGRVALSATGFYRWVISSGGPGTLMFSNVVPTFREIDEGTMVAELRMAPGYEPCRKFFLFCAGGFQGLPFALGLENARVDMSEIPGGGVRFNIQLTPERSTRARLSRLLTRRNDAKVVATELKDAMRALEARYADLQSTREAVERQRNVLETAYQLSQRTWGMRDVDATVETVLSGLVEARFAGARLRYHAHSNPDPIAAEAGDVADSDRAITIAFEAGRLSGSIEAWPGAGEDPAQARQVLELVAPTFALAIDNALAYRELAAYQVGLERRVEERTRDLSAARDALAGTVARLEEVQQSRERIFQNISHEIRTPLSLILLSVDEVLRRHRDTLDQGATGHLATVTTSARKLVRLVDELLLLAAGQERGLQVRPEPLDLGAAIDEIVAGWRLAAQASDLTLTVVTPERVAARADPVALERVLSNLLSNAIKFTPPGGHITVTMTAADPVRVAITDTGLGIDDDLRERLFGRFEQGKGGVASRGGSGIGLSIARELVVAHGGELSCRPNPGGGTEFWFTVPASHETPTSTTAAAARLRPADFGVITDLPRTPERLVPDGPSAGTILIAEDDLALADAIARRLAVEHEVLVAHDGATALALAEQHRPDLLITDVQMPAMDGIELTTRFRDATVSGLPAPVLILSARGDRDHRLLGLAAGAVDYLVKPFDPSELMARVRSHLRHRELALRLQRVEHLASMGALSAGLAHELRNPANGIVNAVGPLRELLPGELKEPEHPVSQLLEVMAECADQVAFLSRQLLGFRRSGELEVRRVPVEDLVSRALANASAALSHVELRTRVDYTGAVRCAPPLLTQVLVNLLENAAQAAGPGGWVEVSTNRENGRVTIAVDDSGPGVPLDLREKVFEPFFTTKPPGQGTGLGLATSRDLVHRHGGTLEIRSRGPRTVFELGLPVPAEVS